MEASPPQPDSGRPHTGRRRNEAAHRAILDAALALLADARGAPITIDAIAAAAGVGKQTIYRWWPSKGAVLLDALLDRADQDVPQPDTGSLHDDLLTLIESTFAGAQRIPTAPALRTLVREASRDAYLAELLQAYTAARRTAVRAILTRGIDRGELSADTDVDLIVDQLYGLFWYRFLLGHGPLDSRTAADLTNSLLSQPRPTR